AADGSISLNPTGQPVTVNGDLTVTGTCTGCGGGTPVGADGEIQFNGNNAFASDADMTWNASTHSLSIVGPQDDPDSTFNVVTGTPGAFGTPFTFVKMGQAEINDIGVTGTSFGLYYDPDGTGLGWLANGEFDFNLGTPSSGPYGIFFTPDAYAHNIGIEM